MILPIVAYGDPVLKKVASPVSSIDPELKSLIESMYETMYASNGVGLAAPQIGKSIRLFVVDGTPIDTLKDSGFRKVFINPTILSEQGEEWIYEEGCLSIPGIRENVSRKPELTIQYTSMEGASLTEKYDGIQARIIQHEYDHLQGILFTDRLGSLKKQLIKGKLSDISKGKVDCDYKMRFPLAEKRR